MKDQVKVHLDYMLCSYVSTDVSWFVFFAKYYYNDIIKDNEME